MVHAKKYVYQTFKKKTFFAQIMYIVHTVANNSYRFWADLVNKLNCDLEFLF